MEVKSPFLVIQNFVSPLLCEQIVNAVDFLMPETNKEGIPQVTIRQNDEAQKILFSRFEQIIPQIEQHYGVSYRGTEPILIEWLTEGAEGSFTCENSSRLHNKWVKTRDRDFSAILFLSDYQDNIPFDDEFEVYGGKLEFPQWNFGFNPQRGTLIIYPSDPHFINISTKILVGDLFQARFHVATQVPFLFNIKDFPGDYISWFRDIT
jgi:hypothetical protein